MYNRKSLGRNNEFGVKKRKSLFEAKILKWTIPLEKDQNGQ